MIEWDYGELEFEPEKVSISKFEDVITWGADWTVGTLYNLIKAGKVDLNPKMQRRDVWDIAKKSRLIESIILNVPIPQIILAENKNKRGQYLVIDGKQRLLTITQFLNEPDDFPEVQEIKFERLVLDGLRELDELNGLSYHDIKKNNELFRYDDIFLNQTIRTIVIKNWEDEAVLFSIFNRLNTGTEKLSPQELRMSLYPGPFLEFINDNSNTKELLDLLKITRPDSRMRDVELIVRYFGFSYFLNNYKGNLQEFLDRTVITLNNSWATKSDEIIQKFEDLEDILRTSKKVFKDNNYQNYNSIEGKYNNRFNKTSFDLINYFLSFPDFRLIVNENPELFKEAYEEVFTDERFASDFSYRTTEFQRVKYRFIKFQEKIQEKFDISIVLPASFEDSYDDSPKI